MADPVLKSSCPRVRDEVLVQLALFVRECSLEVTPHERGALARYARLVPPGVTVYVAHPPRTSFDHVLATAVSVREHGLRAVPHVLARELRSERDAGQVFARLAAAGLRAILLLAGDRPRPRGPFEDTLQVLDSGIVEHHGIECIGVAGHPEGNQAVGAIRLRRALRAKNDFARRTGIPMYIVTQFGFDPGAVLAWARTVAADGIRLPIHVGLAGPAPLAKLIRYAMRCGIGASLRTLNMKCSALTNLVTVSAPDQMLLALARERCVDPASRIVQPHFFTFGGVEATALWIGSIRDGRVTLDPDGTGFSVTR
ncbi:MAG: methylenetetrahydrofolate reductase [Gammaproteobacteria bacterium]|nr:methylenetetrahydrofolate reductase [Gammaproteobacteria bacterium]